MSYLDQWSKWKTFQLQSLCLGLVLTFESHCKEIPRFISIQINVTALCFPVVLFVMMYTVLLLTPCMKPLSVAFEIKVKNIEVQLFELLDESSNVAIHTKATEQCIPIL